MQTIARAFRALLRALACTLFAAGASAEPQNGWWWNPDESGRGFFIEMRGGVIYVGGYFYEDDGRATWMTSGGPLTDPYAYQGTLQAYRGGQTLFGEYRPPAPAVDVGPIGLKFKDDTHGTLTWSGGTVPIERQVFDENVASFRPHTGWWWNPAESGRGFSVEVQGNNAFVVAFMYDDSGNPVWYFAAGPMSSPTRFEGDWLQFSGGQTMTGPYHPPATPQKVGRLAVEFAARDSATLTFTGIDATKSTRPDTKAPKTIVVAQPQLAPQTVSSIPEKWPYYKGYLDRVANQLVAGYDQRIEYLYYDLRWDLTGEGPACPTCDTSAGGVYTLGPGAKVKVTFSSSGYGCTSYGTQEFPVTEGRLEINGDLTYQGELGDDNAELVDVPVVLTCNGVPAEFKVPVKPHDIFGDTDTGIANFYPFNSPIRSYTPHIHANGFKLIPGGSVQLEAWFIADY